ncbi:MAG: hypothetical protein MHM6MM_000061 [Cercozoa sp. M6MM]
MKMLLKAALAVAVATTGALGMATPYLAGYQQLLPDFVGGAAPKITDPTAAGQVDRYKVDATTPVVVSPDPDFVIARQFTNLLDACTPTNLALTHFIIQGMGLPIFGPAPTTCDDLLKLQTPVTAAFLPLDWAGLAVVGANVTAFPTLKQYLEWVPQKGDLDLAHSLPQAAGGHLRPSGGALAGACPNPATHEKEYAELRKFVVEGGDSATWISDWHKHIDTARQAVTGQGHEATLLKAYYDRLDRYVEDVIHGARMVTAGECFVNRLAAHATALTQVYFDKPDDAQKKWKAAIAKDIPTAMGVIAEEMHRRADAYIDAVDALEVDQARIGAYRRFAADLLADAFTNTARPALTAINGGLLGNANLFKVGQQHMAWEFIEAPGHAVGKYFNGIYTDTGKAVADKAGSTLSFLEHAAGYLQWPVAFLENLDGLRSMFGIRTKLAAVEGFMEKPPAMVVVKKTDILFG